MISAVFITGYQRILTNYNLSECCTGLSVSETTPKLGVLDIWKMLDNRYTLVEGIISTLIYVLGQETYFPFNGNCYNKCGCSGNKTSYICGAVTFCR